MRCKQRCFRLSQRRLQLKKLPIEDFARQFTYQRVTLSPDGTKLAVVFLRDDITHLAVLDLATSKAVAVAGVKQPDSLREIVWKSDSRLIYRSIRHDAVFDYVPLLSAVDADGGHRILLNYNPQPNGWYNYDALLDPLPEDADTALIVSEADKQNYPAVYRTNVRHATAQVRSLSSRGGAQWPTSRRVLFAPPGRECEYQTDNNGLVRTCSTSEADGSKRLLYRDAEGGPWVELGHFEMDKGNVTPIGFAPDNRQMYVFSNVGRDNVALYSYDPQRRALAGLLFAADGVDLEDAVYAGDGRALIAVTYDNHGLGIHYLDPDVQGMHMGLNKAFGGLTTQLISFSRNNAKAVVWVGNASTPGSYYLYDAATARATHIMNIAPWIDPKKMARVRSIAFAARDGMPLNGYLTLPRGVPEKDLPLIVNVHGGPIGVRDFAEFDREDQLFANRGYAVLQVNFRGSGGYGREFRAAGHREWGRKMQTDVEDGVKWLVEQGIVDRKRVGIFGGSYGGYAAMMGLITAPDFYKCGVTYASVSNLVRMLNERERYTSSGMRRHVSKAESLFWEKVIGDRHDEAALKEISPSSTSIRSTRLFSSRTAGRI